MQVKEVIPGKLVAVEGTDGGGKGTQVREMVRRARAEGFQVQTEDFPSYGEEPFGTTIGRFLKGEFGALHEINPYIPAGIYAADRLQHAPAIRDALEKGLLVVSNRYVGSNLAHGAAKFEDRGDAYRYIKEIERLEFEMYGIPRPALNVVLDVNPRIAQSNVDKKGKRDYVGGDARDIAEEDLEHQMSASQWYLWLCAMRDDYVCVDCMDETGENLLPIEVIGDRIWEVVRPVIVES